MYEIYIKNKIKEFILDNDLKKLKEKMKEGSDYLAQYEEVA